MDTDEGIGAQKACRLSETYKHNMKHMNAKNRLHSSSTNLFKLLPVQKSLMGGLNESMPEYSMDSIDITSRSIKIFKPMTRFGPVTYLTKHQASGKL